jgi:hypothetical protein
MYDADPWDPLSYRGIHTPIHRCGESLPLPAQQVPVEPFLFRGSPQRRYLPFVFKSVPRGSRRFGRLSGWGVYKRDVDPIKNDKSAVIHTYLWVPRRLISQYSQGSRT